MDACEWFDLRDQWAERMGCSPDAVPPEVVWFVSDRELSEREKDYGHTVAANALPF